MQLAATLPGHPCRASTNGQDTDRSEQIGTLNANSQQRPEVTRVDKKIGWVDKRAHVQILWDKEASDNRR